MVCRKMKLLEKTCCFCCKVKTGALTICYLNLIQSIVPILNIVSNIAPDFGEDKVISDEYKRDLQWLSVATIVIVGHALWGIYKSKPNYMVPFLIYKLLFVFILTLLLGFAPAIADDMKFNIFSSDNLEIDMLPCFIITILLAIGFEGYCLLILFSHYQNLCQAVYAQQVQIPAVMRFSPDTPTEMEAGVAGPYMASQCGEDLPKKSPPPPYAV